MTDKKVRRFYVWAECNHVSNTKPDPQQVLEFSDGETEEEIEAACTDFLDTLIGNNFDTGWSELKEGEEP